LAIKQRVILARHVLSFFVSSALLSLLYAASQELQNTMPFTFVFKYWLRKALVMAHAFYSHISLEILVQFKEKCTVHSCIISVRDVLHFEFKDYPFFAVMKSLIAAKITAALFSGQRHSAIRRQIYVNFIFMQIAFTVSLCVLRMYALLYAYEKSPLVYPKFCAQIECFS